MATPTALSASTAPTTLLTIESTAITQARKLAHKLANARKGQGQDRAFFAAVSNSLGA